MPPHIQIVVQPDDTAALLETSFFFELSARSHHSGAMHVNAKRRKPLIFLTETFSVSLKWPGLCYAGGHSRNFVWRCNIST